MDAPIRTMEELFESTSYGRLYCVEKLVGRRFIAVRYRRHKGKLMPDKSERITIERTEKSQREIHVGDFAFVDSEGVWAHWALRVTPSSSTTKTPHQSLQEYPESE